MFVGHTPVLQVGGDAVHHWPRAADEKVVVTRGEQALDQIDTHALSMLIILAQLILGTRFAVTDMQPHIFKFFGDGVKAVLLDVFSAVARAKEKPDLTP